MRSPYDPVPQAPLLVESKRTHNPRLIVGVAVSALFAVALVVVASSGNGETTPADSTSTQLLYVGYTGHPSDSSAFYTAYATGTEPSECSGGIGDKVPDSCCNGTIDAGNFSEFTCSHFPAAPGLDVRNYFGCDNGTITFAEACIPAGLVLEKTYPFPAEDAYKYQDNGTPKSCGCGADGAFPSIYKGAGCYVAVPSSTEAFYVKFSGSCAAPVTDLYYNWSAATYMYSNWSKPTYMYSNWSKSTYMYSNWSKPTYMYYSNRSRWFRL